MTTNTDATQRPSPPGGPPPAASGINSPQTIPALDMSARLGRALGRRFRMPGPTDPTPRQRRLVGVTLWAAVLGFAGFVASLPLLVGLFTSISTSYAVAFLATGVVGLGSTLGAFASVHRRRLPWMLLGLGTVALIVAWTLNSQA